MEQYRLPKEKTQRRQLAESIGADGYMLLNAIRAPDTPVEVCEALSVEILRQVWVQQYWINEGNVRWREEKDMPPVRQRIHSPYDIEARYGVKRSIGWVGYKVHLTETCDDDTPHLITNVETTTATVTDEQMTGAIHDHLGDRAVSPAQHLVDAGYVDADHLHNSHTLHDIDLIGPVPLDTSWQARADEGFDLARFTIDWEHRVVICPRGQTSKTWTAKPDRHGNAGIRVRFAPEDCHACSCRPQCTHSKYSRHVYFRPQEQFVVLQDARHRQETEEFKETYKRRAGVEGTISQGTRSFDLRRARYVGLAKTGLQHFITAAAINLTRAVAWLDDIPLAPTRKSRFARLAA